MVLLFPRLNDQLGGYSLLGLGDIALPGLLLTFLLRFDIYKRFRAFATRPIRAPQVSGHIDLEDHQLDQADQDLIDPAILADLRAPQSRRTLSDEDYDGLANWGHREINQGCCGGTLCIRIGCFDCWRWDGYFSISLVGYLVGLAITNVALAASETGQPALLYLVPCTLGLISLLAWRRGDLKDMWYGHLQKWPRQGLNFSPQSDAFQDDLSGDL